MLPSRYERKARLTPGLLLLLPVAVTLAVLGFDTNPFVSAPLGLLVAAGGPFVLMTLVSSAGRRIEPRLHDDWGGTPSNQLLRLESDAESRGQRVTWRKALQKHTGVKLAPAAIERENQGKADEAIRTAFGQVRHIGQDDKNYGVVGSENAQYGFERNAYAIRHLARALCVLAIGVTGAFMYYGLVGTATGVVGLSLNILLLLAWIIVPSKRRAREAGFRYASQLLNVVTRLNREK